MPYNLSGGGGDGGDGYVVARGTTITSNVDLGSDYLLRDGLLHFVTEAPTLAGTAGFPIAPAEILGYIEQPAYIADDIKVLYAQRRGFVDDSGLIATDFSNTGFMYSEDGGVTEKLSSQSNAAAKNAIATDGENYIVCGSGPLGSLTVYDYASKTEIATVFAGSSTFYYIYHDTDTGMFFGLDILHDVYTASDPTEAWDFEGSLTGLTNTGNVITKTGAGWIFNNRSFDSIYFTDSLTGALELKVNVNVADYYLSPTFFDKDSLVWIGVGIDSNSRKIQRTTDGGITFSEIAFTGLTSDLHDLVSCGGDVFSASDEFGRLFYTLSAGSAWISTSINIASVATMLYRNLSGDVIMATRSTTERNRMNAILPENPQFISTTMPGNSTDKNYTRK